MISVVVFGMFKLQAQTSIPRNWHLLDYANDSVYGISAEKTYKELLKNRKSNPVIVAIIDSGIDTLHEDLKSVLWINSQEKLNSEDSDKNGYIDDINGWNFLGCSTDENKNVVIDSEEDQRIYFKYLNYFADNTNPKKLAKNERSNYYLWLQSKQSLQNKMEKKLSLSFNRLKEFERYNTFFTNEFNKKEFTIADVKDYQSDDPKKETLKLEFLKTLDGASMNYTNKQIYLLLSRGYNAAKANIKFPETAPEEYRANVVRDDYDNFKDRYYGNKNIRAESCSHGTHVAGIIGADRNNKIGIEGIADNVKIMAIRAIPEGDEHDKDVALAIRYAVDNGAQIINMSFGKSLSAKRKWVEEAIRYAERKNVLLVKAAGNEGENVDSLIVFPTAIYLNNKQASNVINVGASTANMETNGLIAPYSNYGKKTVDVFAPGWDIYSTVQGVDTYEKMSGTSMAAPVVTGMAALIKSYFPNYTAKQIKNIIEKSVLKIDEPVNKPGFKEKVAMSELCRTGGIVNLYTAIRLAEEME